MALEELVREHYYTIAEAARDCNVTPKTIQRWVWSGKLSAEHLGREVFLPKLSVQSMTRDARGRKSQAD